MFGTVDPTSAALPASTKKTGAVGAPSERPKPTAKRPAPAARRTDAAVAARHHGGVFLGCGRECNPVTGLDDQTRHVVIAKVVSQPTSRAVCMAFLRRSAETVDGRLRQIDGEEARAVGLLDNTYGQGLPGEELQRRLDDGTLFP